MAISAGSTNVATSRHGWFRSVRELRNSKHGSSRARLSPGSRKNGSAANYSPPTLNWGRHEQQLAVGGGEAT